MGEKKLHLQWKYKRGVNYKQGVKPTLTAVAIGFKVETSQADTRTVTHTKLRTSCYPFYMKHKREKLSFHFSYEK